MSYREEAAKGNITGTLQQGVLTGTLWAIGISWSTAIRAITLALLPQDTEDQILAEVIATLLTTFFGVIVALVAARDWTCPITNRPITNRPMPPTRRPLTTLASVVRR